MKKVFLLFLACLAVIFYSCSTKEKAKKKVQVMLMSGSIMEAFNFDEVEFSKGDSVVLRNYCNHKAPCQTSIFGYYKGKVLDNELIWKDGRKGGELEASYTYEKAVFLKALKD